MAHWQPASHDYLSKIEIPDISEYKPFELEDDASNEQVVGVDKTQGMWSSDQVLFPPQSTLCDPLWDVLCEEINKKYQVYVKFIELKKSGKWSKSNDQDLKSEIDVSLPQLHRFMELHGYFCGIAEKEDGVPLHLSAVSFKEQLDQTKKIIEEKWNTDMRSEGFDRLNQCANFVFDSRPLHFFPSLFISLVTIANDLRDRVICRIKSFSETTPEVDREEHQTALCINWFLYACCNPLLVPRLYFIICFIPVKAFISQINLEFLLDVVKQIRGVSNPAFSVFLRMYLLQIVNSFLPEMVTPVARLCLDDTIVMFHRDDLEELLQKSGTQVSLKNFYILTSQAVRYIMHFAMRGCKEKAVDLLFKKTCATNSASLVAAFILCVPPESVYSRKDEIFDIVVSYRTLGEATCVVMRALGESLCCLKHSGDLMMLNKCWNLVRGYKGIKAYMLCFPPWFNYVLCFNRLNLIDAMLLDLLKRLEGNISDCDIYSDDVYAMVKSLIQKVEEPEKLLDLNNLLASILCIPKQELVVECCDCLFVALLRNDRFASTKTETKSRVVKFMKAANDNYVVVTVRGKSNVERRIIKLLNKFDFEEINQRVVLLLTEIRSSVSQFPKTILFLVKTVVKFLVRSLSKNVAADVLNLCFCYCIITLPSVMSFTAGMELALICGHVALHYKKLSQAYGFFDLIVSNFDYLVKSPSGSVVFPQLKPSILHFLALTTLIPDHPKKGLLFFTEKIVQFILSSDKSCFHHTIVELLVTALLVLCAIWQKLSQTNVECLLVPLTNYREKLFLSCEKIIENIKTMMEDSECSLDPEVRLAAVEKIKACSNLHNKVCCQFLGKLIEDVQN